jgi:hypothetical protein
MWHLRALELCEESLAKSGETAERHVCLYCNCIARHVSLIWSPLKVHRIPYKIIMSNIA